MFNRQSSHSKPPKKYLCFRALIVEVFSIPVVEISLN